MCCFCVCLYEHGFLWQCFALPVFSSAVESHFQWLQGGFSQPLGQSKTSSSLPSSQFESRFALRVTRSQASFDLVEAHAQSGKVMRRMQSQVSAFQPWQHSLVPIIVHSLHSIITVLLSMYILHNCQLLMESKQHPCLAVSAGNQHKQRPWLASILPHSSKPVTVSNLYHLRKATFNQCQGCQGLLRCPFHHKEKVRF